MRLLTEQSIALIIDIQERLFPHIAEKENLLVNTTILTKGLQALGLPIIVTQQYTRGLGSTINQVKDTMASFQPVEKTAFSCCDEPAFTKQLTNSGKKNVIIAGIETHVCVLQTAIDLIASGYNPVIVEDCVSSRTISNKKIAIERLCAEGAVITSYESVLFELCRFASTDVFKTISKLVK